MAEKFDPYYKWLGIPPDNQPPDLYQLVGVERFESDPDVISAVSEARIRSLQLFTTGPHAEIAKKLIDNLGQARQMLLDPGKRSAYDLTLGDLSDAPRSPHQRVPQPSPEEPAVQITPDISPRSPHSKPYRKSVSSIWLTIGLVGILIGGPVVAGFYIFYAGRPFAKVDNPVAPQAPTQPTKVEHAANSSNAGNISTTDDALPTIDNLQSTPVSEPIIESIPTTKPNPLTLSQHESPANNPRKDTEHSEATPESSPGNSLKPKPEIQPEPKAELSADPDLGSSPNHSSKSNDLSEPSRVAQPLEPSGSRLATERRHAELLAELTVRSRRQPIAVAPPAKPFEGDALLFQVYAEDIYRFRAERAERIAELNQMAAKKLTELSKQLLDDSTQHRDAALSIQAAEKLSSSDVVSFDFPSDVGEKLASFETTYQKAIDDTNKVLEQSSDKSLRKYLDGIGSIIRDLNRSHADPADLQLLLQYKNLLELRMKRKPISGAFVLLFDGQDAPRLFCDGKQIPISRTGVSKPVRLSLHSDPIVVELPEGEATRPMYLSFVTTDGEYQLDIRPEHVRILSSVESARDIGLAEIRRSTNFATSQNPSQTAIAVLRSLKLPNSKSHWFAATDTDQFIGVDLQPTMLKSKHGELSRRRIPQMPDLTGMDVIQMDLNKKVLIGRQNDEGSPWRIEKLCQEAGFATEMMNGFDPNRNDYSNFHTIILAENFLYQFKQKDEAYSQKLAEFVEDGGHLFVWGTYNADGAGPLLNRFGIEVGFNHNHQFEPTGLASALLFFGNEDLVPADRHVSSTSNMSCKSPHTVILKRGPGNRAGTPHMITMNVGQGRLTYAQIQPAYRDSSWIVRPVTHWLRRGSPAPPAEPSLN